MNKIYQTITVEPIGLNSYDTARQRHTVLLIRETESSFFCMSKWDGNEYEMPKYAWREI